jgi:hypothetical protein
VRRQNTRMSYEHKIQHTTHHTFPEKERRTIVDEMCCVREPNPCHWQPDRKRVARGIKEDRRVQTNNRNECKHTNQPKTYEGVGGGGGEGVVTKTLLRSVQRYFPSTTACCRDQTNTKEHSHNW